MARRNIVWLWSVTAALAGFLFGFDTAVISGAEQAVQRVWSMSDVMHGLAISAALWGTVLGALGGSIPSDRFGRRPTLVGIGVLYAVSALGSAFAWDPWSFMAFRFLAGVGIGTSSIATPVYISEIAPPEKRGRLVAMFQFNIVAGILCAYVSNWLLGGMGPNDWRVMLGVQVVPAVLYLGAACLIPESPRWLAASRGRIEEARAILEQSDGPNADAVLAAVSVEQPRVTLTQFYSGRFSRPIALAFLIALFNQLSGINAIIYFAPRLFEMAGIELSGALLASVGIGVTNLVFTIVGVLLIDRMGRRALMFIGSFGYLVSLGMVAWGFATAHYSLVPGFIFLFIAAHAIGQGTVIWVYISEIFPNAARARGQSLGSATHWVMAAALTFAMPPLLASLAPALIFLVFFAMMVLQLLFVFFMMVETRGRTLESVAHALERA
jgi:sugar porter (SP) family MFS transporter